jgi:hypothetical protein
MTVIGRSRVFSGIFARNIPIFGASADLIVARGLLHSRAAFGIALPVAGERSPPIHRMRV